MALPGDLVVVKAYVSSQVPAGFCDDRDRALGGDVLHPLSHDSRIGDVRAEKQQVLLRQGARERHDAVRVGSRHQA
jgi:hypothetical protein